MAYPSVTYSFTNGTTISATEVNQNFTDLINGASDGTKDYNIGALTAAGTVNLNGAVNLGNATSDDITITGYVTSSIIPKTDDTYDLGTAALAWKDGYFDGAVKTDTISELTSGAGVAIDGVTIKDGGIQTVMPAGAVIPFAGASAPSGFLLCDGSAVSRATYAVLFAAISTTFGVGDNSTTFNLPDMRETVAVGVGTRGAGVTAHDTYTLGQFKDDQMQGHNHNLQVDGGTANTALGTALSFGNADSAGQQMGSTGAGGPKNNGIIQAAVNDGTNGTPRLGTTTHTKQIGLNYIIKT
jgi:microcystin-dependent protein